MKKLNVNDFKVFKDFWILEGEKINIVFSNAKMDRSFNRHTDDGVNNLLSLKSDFQVEEVQYIRQIHSDKVFVYKKGEKDFIENEGDAIVTNEKSVIIGAFTADCVPVILVDESTSTIAAIHSGWKGTFNDISKNAVEKMIKEFNCDINNIKAYIGPHIRQCCYEVSEELKEKFIVKFNVPSEKLFNGRNLSMELCIEEDLKSIGIDDDNIYSFNLCTHCEKENKLFSYRASNGTYGRLFSFSYIK
ncbi:peptidoglycan editing factor PgeF [Clostridium disporicum]|uniref:peptidoglycan editing factor PgeF n=1 Tax=Clostridium disporicum TaxID=84024 RepID=UPI00360BC41C